MENELREAMSDTVKEEGKEMLVFSSASSPVYLTASLMLTLLVSVSDI